MATLLSASSDPRFITPANGHSFTLAELHALVGGHIEVVQTKLRIYEAGTTEALVIVINEDGKREPHRRNGFATSLATLREGDYIAGDAVLCTLAELGEDHAATDSV